MAVKVRQEWRRPSDVPGKAPISNTWVCARCRRMLAMTHKWRWMPGGMYRQKWCVECVSERGSK